MKRIKTIYIAVILIFSTVGASFIPLIAATNNQQNTGIIEPSNAPYTGRLRIYVVEPVSRWNMYSGSPYHFGFLGYAFNQDISINPLDTYQNTVTFNSDVTETNAMVIAVLFNSAPHQGYAHPPSGNPFTAYYNDATAAATPGHTGYNVVTDSFTHTVVAEEATATWCPYCPDMATKLNNIYESHDYPFYFIALVADMNSQAQQRINEFNTYGYPTAFFDGGYKVIVGSGVSESTYRSYIQTSGQRTVPDLNMSLTVTYIGSGDLQININILNNQQPNSPPVTPPAPTGVSSGNPGIQYTYSAITTDPEGNDISYWFDWDDGTNSGWIGPYSSGQTVTASHSWSKTGTYDVKVKAKDTVGDESGWSPTLPVTISAPLIDITVSGGLGKIGAAIKNSGTSNLTNVGWKIVALGGLLGMINSQKLGNIPTLAVGQEVSVSTDGFIFGFGKIDVTVTADITTKTTSGFVFGPFVSAK